MLNQLERERYDRQIMIEAIGEKGQEKLQQAKVLIAGLGGLGSPIAYYLAAAGIGTLRIVDNDQVDRSNLNRQILHWEENIEHFKVASATDKLQRLNPHIKIEGLQETIDPKSISRIFAGMDAVVDAMDNLPTRYLLNQQAIKNNIPFFHGAVRGFEGRAMTVIPGKSACLRCMYRGDVPQEKFPVIGVAPAVIGSIQATEVIKYLVGVETLLTNRLLVYDGLNMSFTEFKINKNPNCDHCGHLK
jgi:adenylyltransferase/sulfurtransferase